MKKKIVGKKKINKAPLTGKRKRELRVADSRLIPSGHEAALSPGSLIASSTAIASDFPTRQTAAFAAERWRSHGPVVLEPADGAPCSAAVVWLHGPGGDPEDWCSGLRAVCHSLTKRAVRWKFVSLRAPRLRMASLGGERIAAWGEVFDRGCVRVGSADHDHADSAGHLAATVAEVRQCLDELERCDSVPPSRVILGGFSQGAACALESTLQHPFRVAGCISLAGWLLPSARAALTNSPSRSSSFLICHGERDDKVDPSCGNVVTSALREAGAQVQFKSFSRLGHTASRKELAVVARFMKLTLARGKGI